MLQVHNIVGKKAFSEIYLNGIHLTNITNAKVMDVFNTKTTEWVSMKL